MHWKTIIIICVAGLSANVTADIGFGSCPSGYTLTTYYQTIPIVTKARHNTSSVQTAIPCTSTSTSMLPSSASTGIAIPSKAASESSTTPAISISTTVLPVSPMPQVVQASSATAMASTVASSSSTIASPMPNTPASSVSSTSASQSTASSSSSLDGGIKHGQATSYGGGDVDGTCMFSTANYTLPSGLYGAALSVDNWDTAAWCGACVSVFGPDGKSVKLMIVNQCPGACGLNNLDLLPGGFSQLANLQVGRINVDWEIVPCDIASPLYLSTQSGSSRYWFSIQVVNTNVPVSSLEVSTDGGNTWQPTTRSEYNFFQNPSGFGTDYVDVRITSVTGETIIVNNVNSASETRTDAASNFS